jgi:hypothetical protein
MEGDRFQVFLNRLSDRNQAVTFVFVLALALVFAFVLKFIQQLLNRARSLCVAATYQSQLDR